MIKRIFTKSFIGLSAAFLAACTTQTPQDTDISAASARPWADTYVFAEALYGEPVFRNDVTSFVDTVSLHIGTPKDTHRFSAMGKTYPHSVNGKGARAIEELAAQASDGEDLVIVMLTTHGGPDVLAYKEPGSAPRGITPQMLRDRLAPLSDDQQLIILQACYSGSFIDDLAAPNRIILTAAAADRTSFGCEPNNDNTWYIEALNEAFARGGSLKDIAATAQALVRQREKQQGIPSDRYSNPQIYVGSEMKDIWDQKI